MKTKFLFLWLILPFLGFAQTNTWIGGAPTNSWNSVTNWSLGIVPSNTHDVVIPSGFNVEAGSGISVKSIDLQGNSTMLISGNIAFTNASTFQPGTTVTWNYGNLQGGGILTTKGTMKLASASSKIFYDNTTLTNEGQLEMIGSGSIYITQGTLNNATNGIIDFQTDIASITFSGGTLHAFNNSGTIKKSIGTGNNTISSDFTNNNGKIEVLQGSLILANATNKLNSGIYNVSQNANLIWNSTVTLSGTLTGVLNGPINWNGNVSVPTSTTATLNFTGTDALKWNAGNLQGGGNLISKGILKSTTASSKIFYENTFLTNEGTIRIEDTGSLYITQGTLHNKAIGIIDFLTDGPTITYSGGTTHILNNEGTIKKSSGSGNNSISAHLINNNGKIEVLQGNLIFNNAEIQLNSGTYDVSQNANLNWNNTVTASGTLVGAINGSINWAGNVNVPTTAQFNFTGSNPINWSTGNLEGGGNLTLKSILKTTSSNSKIFAENTTLTNEGTIQIQDTGSLFVTQGIINNTTSGIIDFQNDGPYITYSGGSLHTLNNQGTIKKSLGTGTNTISTELINNNGKIEVLNGNLILENPSIQLNSGIYNVSENANLNWQSTVNPSGTLTGTVNGNINWSGNVKIATGSSATFNFSGLNGVNWNNGNLNGSGTLTNASKLNLLTTSSKLIDSNTVLNNSGILNFSDGHLYITNGIVNNLSSGIINLLKDGSSITFSGGSLHDFNNDGILQKNTGTGIFNIYTKTVNNGTIKANSGTIQMAGSQGFTNTNTGIVGGIGTFDLPDSNFVNNGTFAPGNSPGKLTVIGNFLSSSTSILDTEINGMTPETQYDVLQVQGNGNFSGNVKITLGTVVNDNDEFVIATTSGTISACNLNPTSIATYGGNNYNFDILCRDNNKVIAKVKTITLGNSEVIRGNEISIYPNPVIDVVTLLNKSNEKITQISLYDLSGKLIKSLKTTNSISEKTQLNLNDVASGSYILKIDTEKQNIIKKIIKK